MKRAAVSIISSPLPAVLSAIPLLLLVASLFTLPQNIDAGNADLSGHKRVDNDFRRRCTRNSINLGNIIDALLKDYDIHLLPEADGVNVTIELHVQVSVLHNIFSPEINAGRCFLSH